MTQNVVTIGMDTLELGGWVAEAASRVKREPGSIEARLQLFKLYSLQADWDRALQQLTTILKIDPAAQRQVELFNNLLLSECLRGQVLSGDREACLLEGDLPEWVRQMQCANAFYTAGDWEKGEALRLQALENAPTSSGHCVALGAFSWLSDGDDRLGAICEFICAGGYRWVPFAAIKTLTVDAPVGLTDMIWAKTTLTTFNKTLYGYIPARYPLTVQNDCRFKAGLHTEWWRQGTGRYIGMGRKMWMSSVGECSLFEAQTITFDTVENGHEA